MCESPTTFSLATVFFFISKRPFVLIFSCASGPTKESVANSQQSLPRVSAISCMLSYLSHGGLGLLIERLHKRTADMTSKTLCSAGMTDKGRHDKLVWHEVCAAAALLERCSAFKAAALGSFKLFFIDDQNSYHLDDK